MRIERIVVSSQRKIPHPHVEFGSLSALVSLEAQIGPEDHPGDCTLRLQAECEDLCEQHLRKVAARIDLAARREKTNAVAQAATEEKQAALIAKHGGKL